MERIARIIETNVDGCGTDAELFVSVEMMQGDISFGDAFREAIAEAKRTAEDYDTESLVNDALDILRRKDICEGEVICAPYDDIVEF